MLQKALSLVHKEETVKNKVVSFFALLVLLLVLSPASPAGEQHTQIQAVASVGAGDLGNGETPGLADEGEPEDKVRIRGR